MKFVILDENQNHISGPLDTIEGAKNAKDLLTTLDAANGKNTTLEIWNWDHEAKKPIDKINVLG